MSWISFKYFVVNPLKVPPWRPLLNVHEWSINESSIRFSENIILLCINCPLIVHELLVEGHSFSIKTGMWWRCSAAGNGPASQVRNWDRRRFGIFRQLFQHWKMSDIVPICSMYGIFTNMYPKNHPVVKVNIQYMEHMGYLWIISQKTVDSYWSILKRHFFNDTLSAPLLILVPSRVRSVLIRLALSTEGMWTCRFYQLSHTLCEAWAGAYSPLLF